MISAYFHSATNERAKRGKSMPLAIDAAALFPPFAAQSLSHRSGG